MIKKEAKILFISQHAGFIGGLEKYIFDVANLLRQNGYKTYALYVEETRDAKRYFSAFDRAYNIEELDKISESDFDFTTLHKISEPAILEKILEKFSPTVFVHDHDYFCPKGYKYFPYKRINCRRKFCQMFCGVCASIVPPRHLKNGFKEMLIKNFSKTARLNSLIKKSKSFVVLSEFMKSELVTNEIPQEQIKVLHPFLKSLPDLKENKNSRFEIVVAAQQVMSKGTPYLLEAIKLCKSNLHLNILGSGPRLEDFKALCTSMNLDSKVDFCGWVENPNEYFNNADLAIFPSMWQEPFGLSGIEAMSFSIPVVGFDVGGVGEWLKNNLNGILVPPRDTQAMADAIDKLAQDNSLLKFLGKNAFDFVSNQYSSQTFLTNFLNLK